MKQWSVNCICVCPVFHYYKTSHIWLNKTEDSPDAHTSSPTCLCWKYVLKSCLEVWLGAFWGSRCCFLGKKGVTKGLDQNRLLYREIWMLIPVLKFATKRDLETDFWKKQVSVLWTSSTSWLLNPLSRLLIQKQTGKERKRAGQSLGAPLLCSVPILRSPRSLPVMPSCSTSPECSLLPSPIHWSPSNDAAALHFPELPPVPRHLGRSSFS